MLLVLLYLLLLSRYDMSACGGGVVSAELRSSSRSDEPDAAGEDDWSLSLVGIASPFIATRTEAASRICTC